MSDVIANKKVSGLLEYLDSLVAKGRIRSSAAVPLKSAIKAVFSTVDKDGWEDTSIENIDIDDYITRFKNFTIGNYDAKSYITYRARINRAINWYQKFLDEPGWAPTIRSSVLAAKRTRSANATAAQTSLADAAEGEVVSISDKATLPPVNDTESGASMINFPFPMINGDVAMLRLPKVLSAKDAQRLKSFITTLVLDGGTTND